MPIFFHPLDKPPGAARRFISSSAKRYFTAAFLTADEALAASVLPKVQLMGRGHSIEQDGVEWLLDVAHNPEAVIAEASEVLRSYELAGVRTDRFGADFPIIRERIDNAGTNIMMSNSFGFGGTNASLVFQKFDG